MRIVRLELAIHYPPIDIRTNTIEWNPQLMPHRTSSPITAYKKFSSDLLLLPTFTSFDSGFDRIVLSLLLRRNLVVQKLRITLNERFISHQVSNKDPLKLTLGDNVQSAIPRIRLMSATVEQYFAISIDGGTLNDRAFFVDFGGDAPGGEDFQVAREDSVSAAG